MKTIQFLMVAGGLLIPVLANAQLGKLMGEFHGKTCVTVTQLDKNLYGLYKKDKLSPEAEQMLQRLDEVNFLNLNLNECSGGMEENVSKKFHAVLDAPGNYKLIKSMTDNERQQLVYVKTQNTKVSDLVVWNQTDERLNIIELKGDIQLDNIALLSKALNIKGLHSLAVLNPDNDIYNKFRQSNNFNSSMKDMTERIRQMSKNMQINRLPESFFPVDSNRTKGNELKELLSLPFGSFQPEDFFFPFNSDDPDDFFQSFGDMPDPEDFFGMQDNGLNIISNSVQITEENGKTKIKVNSKNSDMTYVIDGKICKGETVTMPEHIRDVQIRQDPKDMKKSYLFIVSKDKIGQFISNQDKILIFKQDNQEYKYNLGKSTEPLLLINGRLKREFSGNPSEIFQIRPLSDIEKKAGDYKTAEVIINTK